MKCFFFYIFKILLFYVILIKICLNYLFVYLIYSMKLFKEFTSSNKFTSKWKYKRKSLKQYLYSMLILHDITLLYLPHSCISILNVNFMEKKLLTFYWSNIHTLYTRIQCTLACLWLQKWLFFVVQRCLFFLFSE